LLVIVALEEAVVPVELEVLDQMVQEDLEHCLL
jgi:hypothetical protein